MNIHDIMREKSLTEILAERDQMIIQLYQENTKLLQRLKDLKPESEPQRKKEDE